MIAMGKGLNRRVVSLLETETVEPVSSCGARVLLSSTPLLAVTAMAMAGDMERIMAAGFDGYLAKPFTQDQFFAAINTLIREPAII